MRIPARGLAASLACCAMLMLTRAGSAQEAEQDVEPQDTTPRVTEIVIVLTEFAIETPDTVVAGESRFAVTNYGTVEHGFALGRARSAAEAASRSGSDGSGSPVHAPARPDARGPPEQARQAASTPEYELERTLLPGETATLDVELQPGIYRIWCPVDQHAEEGMSRTIQVAARADAGR